MSDWRSALLPQLSKPLREMLERLPDHVAAYAREIRIRAGRPLSVIAREEYFIGEAGVCDAARALRPDAAQCRALLEAMCGQSVYAHEEEIRQGYLSLRGGFRCGLSGRAAMENGQVVNMTNIGGFAIRIAQAVPGAARPVLPHALVGSRPRSTLILSPPGMGKTTMLRDLIRLASDAGAQIAVADERGEIAACYQGQPQLDVGLRTDVIDGCPKGIGVRMAIRSLSPRIVATDEIGMPGEAEMLLEAANSGVAVFATAHARDWQDAARHARLGEMMRGFERAVVLGGNAPGQTVTVLEAATGKPVGQASAMRGV